MVRHMRDAADLEPSPDFANLADKRSRFRDLHALMLLDTLEGAHVEKTPCAISAAEHDEIYLDFDPDKVAANITPEQCVELVACGVHWDSQFDCFHKFV
jgi:hypothetical protein